jgi:hypothetical protein
MTLREALENSTVDDAIRFFGTLPKRTKFDALNPLGCPIQRFFAHKINDPMVICARDRIFAHKTGEQERIPQNHWAEKFQDVAMHLENEDMHQLPIQRVIDILTVEGTIDILLGAKG